MSANEFKLNADEKPFDPPDAERPKAQKPRDAATLILVRGGREVMMGQRGKGHVFMPDKFCDGEATMAELKRFNAALYRTQLERIQGWIAAAKPYWFGERLSFHDAYALTLLRWGGFAGIDPDSLPTYKAYVDRVAAHPAVAAAIAREGIKLSTFRKA